MTPTLRHFPLLFASAVVACAPVAGDTPDAAHVPLAGPPGFMVMEMGDGLHATWQDPYSNETGFELQRREGTGEFVPLIGLDPNVTDHHDATVTPEVAYTYRVRAIAADGPGDWSSESTATLPAPQPEPPGAPTQLSAGKMGSGLHVFWRDNSSDETGFELERKAGAGEFAKVASVAANTNNRMDSAVTAGTTYTYRVRAVGAAGPSEWSNEASGTP